jgi:hypothetical protein
MDPRFFVSTAAVMIGATIAIAAPAGRLSPKEIQDTFFTGAPFTAATPANVKFKMTFTADGKMTREPIGRPGAKSAGTWKLSSDGFCTTWSGSKQNCYRVQANGSNKWAVMVSMQPVAYWSK